MWSIGPGCFPGGDPREQRQGMPEASLPSSTSKPSCDLCRRSRGGHGHPWSASGLPCAFERLAAFSFFPPWLVSQRAAEGRSRARGQRGGWARARVLWSLEHKPHSGGLERPQGTPPPPSLEASSPKTCVSAGLAPSRGSRGERAPRPWPSFWGAGSVLGDPWLVAAWTRPLPLSLYNVLPACHSVHISSSSEDNGPWV